PISTPPGGADCPGWRVRGKRRDLGLARDRPRSPRSPIGRPVRRPDLGGAVSDQLALTSERPSYKPGERIAGTVEVLEDVNAKELTVVREYREITSDYRVVGPRRAAGGPNSRRRGAAGRIVPVQLRAAGRRTAQSGRQDGR